MSPTNSNPEESWNCTKEKTNRKHLILVNLEFSCFTSAVRRGLENTKNKAENYF